MVRIRTNTLKTKTQKNYTTRSHLTQDKIAQEHGWSYNTPEWKRLRKAKLQETGGLCECCLYEGKLTPARDVHHLDSFTRYQGELRQKVALNPNNLASLCRRHHSKFHRILQMKGEVCNGQSVEQICYIVDGFKKDKPTLLEEMLTNMEVNKVQ